MTLGRTFRGCAVFLVVVVGSMGVLLSPRVAEAQTAPATELQLLSRIAEHPDQLDNYLDLAKLYDRQRRYQDAETMLTRAMAIVRSEQGAIAFGKPVLQTNEQPLRVGAGVREPRRIKTVSPEMPEIARAAHISGVVILELRVGKDGSVTDARILRSIPILDAAAIDAVKQWRYQPTLLNGAPTEVVLTATVTFQNDARPAASIESATLTGTPVIGQPLRVGGDIKEPRRIKNVAPVYPDDARAAGVSGVVILEAVIDLDGRVSDVRVLRSIPLLDQAAIDAVRQWTYTPTLLNGTPVSLVMTVTVVFVPQ